MAKNFGTNPRRKLYQNLSIVVVILIFVAIMSSFTLSWFMDESTTSNGEPNITLIGDLDMDVTTNFKFKNLALAPDTVYTSDQDNTDIATYIKTSAKHNIDGAYVRIKFETERKNVGTSEYVNNLDLLKLYFDGNLTTSTNYSDESTKNKWFYNASDDYYYYLGGVYETNVMFNAGYKTSNRMINDFASAQVTIDFTVDCIQRQYGASEAVWATAPQVFKDMVSTESNITHVVNRMPIVIDGVSNYYNVETGYTVEEILKVTGLNNTITNSNSCGWYADPECTIPLDPDDIVTSSTKFYTKKATTEKLNITTDSSGKKTVTAINESITGEVVIPNDVEVIGTRAFNNVSISSIVIPESVTTIERLAISASSLTSLYIPKSVTSIASYMGSPSTLESIVVASENPKYTSGGGLIAS